MKEIQEGDDNRTRAKAIYMRNREWLLGHGRTNVPPRPLFEVVKMSVPANSPMWPNRNIILHPHDMVGELLATKKYFKMFYYF